MRSKVIFEKISKQDLYLSKIARNVIQSEFRTSKMADGSHFVKKNFKNLRIDLKWTEMRPKVIFGRPKWLPAAIF